MALIGVTPVLVLAAIGIKLTSPGPMLYRAQRVGHYHRNFVMFKLRTMHVGLGESRISGGRDPRVFPLGRVLRRLKIDELPQLANVVRGDMALVGPRPEDPDIVSDHYEPFMLETLDVLPGLTSPGSLSYYAAERNLPDDPIKAQEQYVVSLLPRKIAMDLVYVRNRSWRYDLELLVRTLAALVGVRSLFETRVAWEQAEAARLLTAARPSRPVTRIRPDLAQLR